MAVGHQLFDSPLKPPTPITLSVAIVGVTFLIVYSIFKNLFKSNHCIANAMSKLFQHMDKIYDAWHGTEAKT